jgi:hypothetical protein
MRTIGTSKVLSDKLLNIVSQIVVPVTSLRAKMFQASPRIDRIREEGFHNGIEGRACEAERYSCGGVMEKCFEDEDHDVSRYVFEARFCFRFLSVLRPNSEADCIPLHFNGRLSSSGSCWRRDSSSIWSSEAERLLTLAVWAGWLLATSAGGWSEEIDESRTSNCSRDRGSMP